jgi:transglutaminase-like putative cysteine protease
MRRIIPLLCVLAFFFSGNAQNLAEIQQKFPGENAAMLEHTTNYRISLQNGQPVVQSDETHQIIYLSANSGAYFSKYGFTHSGFHELQQYAAYTRTAADKKVKVDNYTTTDSKSSGVFYDDVKETTFDFPDVSAGAVGNLELSIVHKDPHLLSPFYFTRSLPVVHAQLKITFPRNMSLRYLIKGTSADKVQFTREERHGEITYTFQAKDLDADKSYPDAPDADWYATKVIFFIEKYTDENGQTINYLSGPDDLYRLDRGFLKDINKTVGPEMQRLVDSLTAGASTPEEKTRRIYGWVQNNIKYIAFEQGMEGFVPRDANLVCSRRFGDCKDMSSILTTMLRAAHIPAYYTWIGTRDLPYTYAETPTPICDNHMICTVLLNGEYIFLDGTDPFCVFGMPTEFIQDKQAMVAIDDSTYKILTVPVVSGETNRQTDSTYLELTDDGLKGKITQDLHGYTAMRLEGQLTYTNRKDDQETMKARFYRGSNKFHLDSFRVVDLKDKGHIGMTADFHLQDYAKRIGGDWYINLNLFKFYFHEEIDYPKRQSPIAYDYRNERRYVIALRVPDGYQVSYLPQNKSYHNPVWGFDLRYEQQGNLLILTQEFDNDRLMLQPDQFAEWNKVLENLIPLYKETVSLSKK